MSDFTDIKQHLNRLTELGNSMREQIKGLGGPEGEAIKKRARQQGTRLGIGAGISLFGLIFAAITSLYITLVVILLVDIALDRLWLSALIVVGGLLIIGGAIIAVGAGVSSSAAKELARTKDDATREIKKTAGEMKSEVEELQKITRKEAESIQKQAAQKATAIAPAIVGAYLVYRLGRRVVRARREKREILRTVELVEKVLARRGLT